MKTCLNEIVLIKIESNNFYVYKVQKIIVQTTIYNFLNTKNL